MFFKKKPPPAQRFEPLTSVDQKNNAAPGEANPFNDRFRDATASNPKADSSWQKASSAAGSSEPKTTVVPQAPATPSPAATPPPATGAEPKTQLFTEPLSNASKTSGDPPVGWLAIVEGPGFGHAFPIGYGMNSVGRGEGQRICIDFGDSRISRVSHAFVIYDGENRKFYVAHGGGENLTYLNGDLVLGDKATLVDRDILKIGDTKLIFIQLCNEQFDWKAMDAA